MSTAVETGSLRGAAGETAAPRRVHAAVVGATGYAGGELLSILARHPFASIACLMSSGREGKKGFPIDQVHPRLRGRITVLCEPLEVERVGASAAEVVFLATPHETSHQAVPTLLAQGLRVVDLSGAFRLKNSASFRRWYGFEHQAREALAEAVYGIPELAAPQIAAARLVSNPGCYATSVILALAPLVRAGWVDLSVGIIADSKSGASGAGRAPSDKLHFPEVNENLRVYGLFHHRHVPEMLEALNLAEGDFVFTPHLLPITRGILSTIYVRLSKRRTALEVEELLGNSYAAAPLVRVYAAGNWPEIQAVAHTPYVDLGFALDPAGRRLILVSALDNLGKGAAAQAIQNMNVMFGFPEETGLL